MDLIAIFRFKVLRLLTSHCFVCSVGCFSNTFVLLRYDVLLFQGIALHSIRRWAAVASMRVKNNSVKDLALVRDSWKMLLHCSGNIHMATTRLASLKTTKRAKVKGTS